MKKITLGLLQKETYASGVRQAILSDDRAFEVAQVANESEGMRWLKEKKIGGLLLKSGKEPGRLILVVLKKESLLTLSIVERFSALQKAVESIPPDWISGIQTLQGGGVQKQTLPTWILMLVLMVSFIVMPAQVAEEKEKKLLLALLQTPMRETEWLIAKLLLGMILIHISILFLHLLGGFDLGNALSYTAMMGIGSFCFSAYGIFLGLLCRNQASARTLGVIFYLPHLLPSALSDYSTKLTAIAPFLPSYQFFGPLKSILLEDGRISNYPLEWMYLLIVGLVTFFLSYRLMKKRWLM